MLFVFLFILRLHFSGGFGVKPVFGRVAFLCDAAYVASAYTPFIARILNQLVFCDNFFHFGKQFFHIGNQFELRSATV